MGLAEAMEREERLRSHPSEMEREEKRGKQRRKDMEIVGGRNSGELRRLDLFFLRI